MGDTQENMWAEHAVHSLRSRLHHDFPPNQTVQQCKTEPVQVLELATSALASSVCYDWRGFELHLLTSSTPGVELGVAFNDSGAGACKLRAGESIRVGRQFERVWLKSTGNPGTARLALVTVPVVELEPARRVRVEEIPFTRVYSSQAAPIYDTVYCDSGALDAGVYEAIFDQQTMGGTDIWSFNEHRNAANSATLFCTYRSSNHFAGSAPHHWPAVSIAQGERLRVRCMNTPTPVGYTWDFHLSYRRIG